MEDAMSNTLDEILHKHQNADYDYNTTDAKQQLLEEVLDMIGEDEIGNIGYDGEDMVDDTTDEMHANNRLKHQLRKAAKERFK